MKDIYNRLATDQSYVPALETDDEIEQILAQIKMILGTKKGDILCDLEFGLDLEQYIFSMDYNQQEINEIVQTSILNNIYYDDSKYNVEVSVDFGKDASAGSDYAVLNVAINQIRYLGIVMNQ